MRPAGNDRMTKPREAMTLYYRGAFFAEFAWNPEDEGSVIAPAIRIWTQHPAMSAIMYKVNQVPEPANTITVHLDRTPWKASRNHKTQVEVDDHTHNNGYTTIGPMFPQAYGSGGVYLSEALCNSLPSGPKAAATSADLTMIVHWEPSWESGVVSYEPVRHHGFLGTQVDATKTYPNLWIVWHPGSANASETMHWRAPRKLWIPDVVKYVPSPPPLYSKAPLAEPIYLEQDYATYVAALDVPKQPSASGEGGSVLSGTERGSMLSASGRHGVRGADAAAGVQSPEPPAPAPQAGTPVLSLNVISRYAPGEIYEIGQKVKNGFCVIMEEGESLVGALTNYLSKPRPKFTNLDLIGHSRSRDYILKMGEFALTSRVAAEQFAELRSRGILTALGVTAIRLLGCRTAAHPRGQRVVQKIKEETDLDVYATRMDLFAIHYDKDGLSEAALPLLADDQVIMNYGPGDIPPRDDFPADPPNDDDDDDSSGAPVVVAPDRFSLAALSEPNAARVAAKRYVFWDWTPAQFSALTDLIYVDTVEQDNPLRLADYEVILPISREPRDISDFASFDLFLSGDRPRVRVNRSGASFAFALKGTSDTLRASLQDPLVGIMLGPAAPAKSA